MFAVIYIPDFQLQASLRHEPEQHARPVVLLDSGGKHVFQLTSVARAAGVSEGLTSTQALARCSTVGIRLRSPALETSAADVLLECAYLFSPNIEATAPGICTLDLKGLQDLQPASWAQKIIGQLALFNLRAQIGTAENPDLALQAAKIAQPIFLVENSVEFLAALPVESIEPSADVLEILHRWGIRTLGEFVALEKDRLVERLGSDALELFDRATANTDRPLVLVRPKEVFEESAEFEQEIETLQPLLFILRRFIEQLSRRLELFYFVAQEIQLRLTLATGEKLEHSFRVPSPTRNIETLFRMLQARLETIQTESPVVALQLAVKPSKPEHFQFGLFETALRDPNHFYETMAQLTSLFGAERVGTPVLENTFRPDAFHVAPVNFETEFNGISETLPTSESNGLPLRRFRPPLPAIVQMRDGKPALLNSEKFVGAITKARGPYRLSGNWWEQQQLWSRDEWDVEASNGELFRLFAQDGDWFLEGEYD